MPSRHCLAGLALVASVAAAQVTPVDERAVSELVLGGGATPLPYARLGGDVVVWRDGAWKPSRGEHPRPAQQLASAPSGVVALSVEGALWRLIRHDGPNARDWLTSELPLPPKARLRVSPRGDAFLVGDDRALLWVRAQETRVQRVVLPAARLTLPERPGGPACVEREASCRAASGEETYCGQLDVLFPGDEVVLWSRGSSNSYVLPVPTALRDGRLADAAGPPADAPKRGVTHAVTEGADVVFALGHRLYRRGPSGAVVAEPSVPQPEDANVRAVAQLFAGGGRLFALLHRPFQAREGALWERTPDGWRERSGAFSGQSLWPGLIPLAAQVTAGPSAFASPGLGLWLVDERGAASLVDSARGFPGGAVTGLARLGEGWLVADAARGTFLVKGVPGAQPAPYVHARVHKRALAPRPDGTLAWLSADALAELRTWDGKAVTTLPRPSDPPALPPDWYNATLAADEAGALWLLPRTDVGLSEAERFPGVVYRDGTPATGASFLELLAASRAARFTGFDEPARPKGRADGALCVADEHRTLQCRAAGQPFHRVRPEDVQGGAARGSFWDGALALDGGIGVTVNLLGQNRSYALSEDARGWLPVERPAPPTDAPVPAGCASGGRALVTEDGRQWLVDGRGALWATRGAQCTRRLPDGVLTPLAAGARVEAARFDPAGHDVLVFQGGAGLEWVALLDVTTWPTAKATVKAVHDDEVTLSWAPRAPAFVEWRLGHGVARVDDAQRPLGGVPPGQHTLFVRAVDATLRAARQWTELRVNVRFDREALATELVRRYLAAEGPEERAVLLLRLRAVAEAAAKRLEAEAKAKGSSARIDEALRALATQR